MINSMTMIRNRYQILFDIEDNIKAVLDTGLQDEDFNQFMQEAFWDVPTWDDVYEAKVDLDNYKNEPELDGFTVDKKLNVAPFNAINIINQYNTANGKFVKAICFNDPRNVVHDLECIRVETVLTQLLNMLELSYEDNVYDNANVMINVIEHEMEREIQHRQ